MDHWKINIEAKNMSKHYNPMSKEFQEEAKRLGLTGSQLTTKYKKEGKSIKKEETYIRNIVPRPIHYNETDTCDRCGISFEKAPGHPYREYDKEGRETGRWDCHNCRQKYDPTSDRNVKKSLRNHRTGNLDPNCSTAKGDLFQELTCIWRSTVSTVPVEDMNKKLDSYRCPIDHSYDSELGYIQTKGKLYDFYNKYWSIKFDNEHNMIIRGFKFDNAICYCANKDGNIIERMYIFPIKEIVDRSGVTIVKYSRGELYNVGWYEKYRVKDEGIIQKVNEIWKKIIGK